MQISAVISKEELTKYEPVHSYETKQTLNKGAEPLIGTFNVSGFHRLCNEIKEKINGILISG